MPTWLQQDWCSSFVLTLGHFLWQGTLVAVVLALALRATKSVAARYWLSLATLLVMAACPVVTLGWLMQPVSQGSGVQNSKLAAAVSESPTILDPPILNFEHPTPPSDVGQVSNLPVMPSAPAVELNSELSGRSPNLQAATDDRSWWQKFAPQLTTTYLCGVGLMLLRLVFGLWGGRRLRRRVQLIDDPSLLAAMRRQAEALGLKLLPILAYCERVTVPTVVGVLKPMILLPLTLTSGLSAEQIESVLAHELAHLRRYDHLVNLLQRVIESLLFFHPAMWWVSHRVREEREHCCDDLVVACGAMPLDYAKSLLRVAELSRTSKLRRSVAAVSLLATGDKPSSLRQRISRLLGESATPSLRLSPRVLTVSITILLVGLVTLIQLGVSNDQPKASVSNQVASYKATFPNGDTVELVHLTTASFSVPAVHKRVWWKGDGTLDVDANAREANPKIINRAPLNARHVDIRAKTAAGEPSLCLKTLPATDTRHQVYSDSKDQQGNSVRTFSADFGPIGGEKSAALRVGVAPDAWGDWQQISPTGELLNKLDESRPHWSSYQQIKVLRAGPVFHTLIPPAGTPVDPDHWIDTAVVLEWPRNHDELFAFEFRAVSNDGKTHMAIDVSHSQTDDRHTSTFHLNGDVFRDRLARFEYRLRPYRHWVTFENVALHPGPQTDVKVKMASLPIETARLQVKNADGSKALFNGVVEAHVGFPKFRLKNWAESPTRDGSMSLEKLLAGQHWLLAAGDGLERNLFSVTTPADAPLIERRLRATPDWWGKNIDLKTQVETNERTGDVIVLEIHNGADREFSFSEADVQIHAEIQDQLLRGLSPSWRSADFQIIKLTAGQTGRLRLNWREWVKSGLWSSRDHEPIGEPALPPAEPGKISIRVGLGNGFPLPISVTDPQTIAVRDEQAIDGAQRFSSPLRFSETTEIVLSMNSRSFMLDLDSGMTTHSENPFRRVLTKMDLRPIQEQPDDVASGLMGLALRGVRAKPTDWNVSVAELQKELASDRVGELKKLPYDPDETATYFFRTTDGTDGILQLLAQTDVPKGIRLRYKTFAASKLNAEIKVGMTFDELIALKGRHYRLSHGMRVGHLILVYDDIAISVDAPPNAKEGGKVTGFEPGIPREVVANVPYADEETSPPKGLEFLKPYPKLHGLSLDMTEPQFLEIAKQQELKTRKTVEGEKVTHHIDLGDGHSLIVMFDKEAKCSGIQRVRGDEADDQPAAARKLGAPSIVLPDHLNVMALGFDREGKELVSVAIEHDVAIRAWDLVEKKLKREVKLETDKHGNFFLSGQLTLSGDRKRVLAILDGKVMIWDAATGKLFKTLELPEEMKHGLLSGLACTPDLSVVACGREPGLSGISPPDAHAIVWDVATGKVLRTVKHTNAVQVHSLALSPDGKLLATGGQQTGTCLWEIRTGTLLHQWPNNNPAPKHSPPDISDWGHYQILCLRFSPDGQRLALGDMLGVKMMEIKSGKLLFQCDAPFRYGRSGLVFSKDGQLLARTATDKVVPIWSAHTGKLLVELPTEAHGGCFSDDGRSFAVGFSDRKQAVAIWPLNGDAAKAADSHAAPPNGLEYLKPYPKLHGLSLDMTEPQFLEIVKQQELKTRKTVEGEKVTHQIALGDGHTLIVMFDKDAKCSGIQRVRGDENSDAGRGSGDWGPTTNGLRARVVPVLSSMSEDAIGAAQRAFIAANAKGEELMFVYSTAEDVAFAVEIENVSDKPIKLVDLWHNAKDGKAIQDADWLSQFVYTVVLFDGDGKRIEQPEIEVEDPVFNLHDAQVTTLQPGKTQQFLIKTVEWLPAFKPQIQAGRYRVAVRYQWLSGPNAARTREAHPKSSLIEAAAVNVVSAAVVIEVGGERQKADPDLVWGKAINGLRAAVSFEPSKASYTHGDKLAVNLHLQNVGTQPLKLVTDLSLPDASATIKNEMGKRVALDDRGGGLSLRLRGLLTLKPQQVVVLDAGNLGLASSKEQAKQLDEETIRQLTAPVGKYSMQLANAFNNSLTQRVFVPGQELVRVKDAWVGKLTTGATPLVIATAPVVGVRGEVEDKPAEIRAFVQVFPPPVVGDFSKVNDPDELLNHLAKSQLPSLVPMSGGGFFQQPGAPPQALYVGLWETQYAGNDKLDPRIRRLIELGDRAVPRVHQRLNGLVRIPRNSSAIDAN